MNDKTELKLLIDNLDVILETSRTMGFTTEALKGIQEALIETIAADLK